MSGISVDIATLLGVARQMRSSVEPLAGAIEAVPTGVDTGNGGCDAAVSRAVQSIIDTAGGFGQSLAADCAGLTAIAEVYEGVDASGSRSFNALAEEIFGPSR